MSKVVIISGSPSPASRLNAIVDRVEEELSSAGLSSEVIRVREFPAEDLLLARFDSESIVRANERVKEAEAVVIATPIYKAAYSGLLKTFLDTLPQKGLEHKIVLLVAIGGTIAHLLAIDYVLKPVLAALGARHLLPGVYVQDTQVARTDDGSATIAEEAAARLRSSVQELVRELAVRNRTEAVGGGRSGR